MPPKEPKTKPPALRGFSVPSKQELKKRTLDELFTAQDFLDAQREFVHVVIDDKLSEKNVELQRAKSRLASPGRGSVLSPVPDRGGSMLSPVPDRGGLMLSPVPERAAAAKQRAQDKRATYGCRSPSPAAPRRTRGASPCHARRPRDGFRARSPPARAPKDRQDYQDEYDEEDEPRHGHRRYHDASGKKPWWWDKNGEELNSCKNPCCDLPEHFSRNGHFGGYCCCECKGHHNRFKHRTHISEQESRIWHGQKCQTEFVESLPNQKKRKSMGCASGGYNDSDHDRW